MVLVTILAFGTCPTCFTFITILAGKVASTVSFTMAVLRIDFAMLTGNKNIAILAGIRSDAASSLAVAITAWPLIGSAIKTASFSITGFTKIATITSTAQTIAASAIVASAMGSVARAGLTIFAIIARLTLINNRFTRKRAILGPFAGGIGRTKKLF